MDNIVFVNFECNETIKSVPKKIWQYGYGQILRIQGLNLPSAVEIHFSLQKSGGVAERRIGVTRDGVTDVVIPDFILENEGIERDYTAYAFIYLSDTIDDYGVRIVATFSTTTNAINNAPIGIHWSGTLTFS